MPCCVRTSLCPVVHTSLGWRPIFLGMVNINHPLVQLEKSRCAGHLYPSSCLWCHYLRYISNFNAEVPGYPLAKASKALGPDGLSSLHLKNLGPAGYQIPHGPVQHLHLHQHHPRDLEDLNYYHPIWAPLIGRTGWEKLQWVQNQALDPPQRGSHLSTTGTRCSSTTFWRTGRANWLIGHPFVSFHDPFHLLVWYWFSRG